MHTPISQVLKNLGKAIDQNSPAILTAIGVAGTVSTSILAVRATVDAASVIHERYVEEVGETDITVKGALGEYTLRAKAEMTWRLYVPAVATGAVTVGCILAANHVNSKRTTALVTAYSLTENAFKEYKEKVVEQLGVNKETKVRDAIAQDKLDRNPSSGREIIIAEGGDVLCYETYTGRYFKSDMETLRKAQNDINQQIISEMYASLNDFFNAIGLPNTSIGDTLGWTMDEMLELHFSALLEDGKPCIAVGYHSLPVKNFHKFG